MLAMLYDYMLHAYYYVMQLFFSLELVDFAFLISCYFNYMMF